MRSRTLWLAAIAAITAFAPSSYCQQQDPQTGFAGLRRIAERGAGTTASAFHSAGITG